MTTERVWVRVTGHAIDRAEQKFGLFPTDEQWAAALTDVLNGRSVCIARNEPYETHLVMLCDTQVKMLIDTAKPSVVTLLTMTEGNKRVREANSKRISYHPPNMRRMPRGHWLRNAAE